MTDAPGFPLTDRFTQALILAVRWHHGHYRDAGPEEQSHLPYLSHVLGAVAVALDHGASEDEAIATLLHSALTRPSQAEQRADNLRGELLDRFGLRVTVLVDDAADWQQRALTPADRLNASAVLMLAADHLTHNRHLLGELLQLPAEQRSDYFALFGSSALVTLRRQQAVAEQLAATPALSKRPRLSGLIQQLNQSVDALASACDLRPRQLREGQQRQSLNP